jgi:hypothetical protein
MKNEQEKRPIGLLSIDTRLIYGRLVQAEVGETIGYEELGALIGRDVRNGSRWVLQSARRKAFSEDRMMFGVISKVGLKRLSESEKVHIGEHQFGKVHRAARRGAKEQASVDVTKLTGDELKESNRHASIFGLMAHFTKPSSAKRLNAALDKSSGPLPVMRTLEAFRDS